MDYTTWFSERIAHLRNEKGVSARDMSLTLGQSESYINKIENKKSLPSMTGFFYICEYFSITPEEFFSVEKDSPLKIKEISDAASNLSTSQAEHILQIIKDILS